MDENKKEIVQLGQEERMFVLKLWAEGWSAIEIGRELQEQYNIKHTRQSLYELCKEEENQIYIDEFREKYFESVKVVPIANKRVRLDCLERSRKLLMKMLDVLCIDGRKSTDGIPKSENQRSQILMVIRRMNEVLSFAREEMEGKSHILQQFNYGNFPGMSDSQLQKRKEEIIAKATGNFQSRDIGIGSDPEGIKTED